MKRINIILVVFVLLGLLTSCKKTTTKQKMNISSSEFTIMEDTLYETKGYIIDSGIDGPKIAIIGGTHGNETAGFTACLNLKDKLLNGEYYFIGSILLIPEANKYACDHNSRKEPLPGDYTNELNENNEYFNLNRNFPGSNDGSLTEKLAYEIVKKIEDFEAKYYIDCHESTYSHTLSQGGDKYEWLGETLICGNQNSSAAADAIINTYNKKYSGADFDYKMNPEKGSFNYYFSGRYYTDTKLSNKSYLRAICFTIETTRTDVDLNTRVTYQLNMLDSILNYIYTNI